MCRYIVGICNRQIGIRQNKNMEMHNIFINTSPLKPYKLLDLNRKDLEEQLHFLKIILKYCEYNGFSCFNSYPKINITHQLWVVYSPLENLCNTDQSWKHQVYGWWLTYAAGWMKKETDVEFLTPVVAEIAIITIM